MPAFNSGTTISDHEWHHIALSVDEASDKVIFYIDNIKVNETTYSSLSVSEDSSLYVGFNYDGTEHYVGFTYDPVSNKYHITQWDTNNNSQTIDFKDVTVFESALTPEQIEDTMATIPLVELSTSSGNDTIAYTGSFDTNTLVSATNVNVVEDELMPTTKVLQYDSSQNSKIEVSSTSLDKYKVNQFTMSSWINPSAISTMPLMYAPLTDNRFAFFKMNSEGKIEFEATTDAIWSTTHTLNENGTNLSIHGTTAYNDVSIGSVAYFTEQTEETVRNALAAYSDESFITTQIPSAKTFQHTVTHAAYNDTTYEMGVFPEVHVYTLSGYNSLEDAVPNVLVNNVVHKKITLAPQGVLINVDTSSVSTEAGFAVVYQIASANLIEKHYAGVFATAFADSLTDQEMVTLLQGGAFTGSTYGISTPTAVGLHDFTRTFTHAINSSTSADESPIDSKGGYTFKAFVLDSSDAIITSTEYVKKAPQPNAFVVARTALETDKSIVLAHPDVWTVSVWVKFGYDPTVTAAVAYQIFDFGYGTLRRRNFFAYANNYGFNKGFGFSTGQIHGYEFDWEIERWYHVALTQTSGGIQRDTLTLYVDGQVIPTGTGGTSSPSQYGPGPLALGASGTESGENTMLYQFAMYDTTLTSDEVNQTYTSGIINFTDKEPIALYEFSSYDTKLNDTQGNYPLTIRNASSFVDPQSYPLITQRNPSSDYGSDTSPNAFIVSPYCVQTDAPLGFTNKDVWSISCWVKFSGLTQDVDTMLFHWGTDGSRGVFVHKGAYAFRVTSQAHYWNSHNWELGRWYHLVLTSTTGGIQRDTLKVYIDGVILPTSSGGTDMPRQYTPSSLIIGDSYINSRGHSMATYTNPQPNYNIMFYQVAIYNTTLSPTEVEELRTTIIVKNTSTTPIALYEFNSEGTKFDDAMNNAYPLSPFISTPDPMYSGYPQGHDSVSYIIPNDQPTSS